MEDGIYLSAKYEPCTVCNPPGRFKPNQLFCTINFFFHLQKSEVLYNIYVVLCLTEISRFVLVSDVF